MLIKTKQQHQAALKKIRELWDVKPNSEELEILSIFVENYESKYCKFSAVDPIEAIKFRMEQQGLRQKDVVHIFGGKNRVSEVLSRKMSLTLKMIKNLHRELKIPYESLLGD